MRVKRGAGEVVGAGGIIVGVDPGLASTGFGVVAREGRRLRCRWYGHLSTPSTAPTSERLVSIHRACVQVLEQFPVEALAVETLFFGASAPTALAVGQARGVVLLAAAERGIPTFDYAPSQVKQAVTGHGRADKRQVQEMVQVVLGMSAMPRPDHAADALAIAACHAAAAPLGRQVARAIDEEGGRHDLAASGPTGRNHR